MSRKKCSESGQQIQKLLVQYAKEANEEAQFSQRKRQMNAEQFVQGVVLGWLKNKEASLNELAEYAQRLGCRISAAGLHERMNGRAVMLLAGVLSRALKDVQAKWPLPLAALAEFKGIYVTDSTQIAFPKHLSHIFAGNGQNSQVKLQVTWDYLHGNLAALEIEAGRTPDQKCQQQVRCATAGSLQLFDLGYFKQEYLRDIDQQRAFFVCRYQSQTGLYGLDKESAFDLVAWLNSLEAHQADIEVVLGQRVKLRLRLCARRLSPQASAQRRRAAKAKAQKQGQTCSQRYLALLDWDILLTNLPPHSWPLPRIFDLYPLRFQIEWLFRTWKDQLGLDAFGNWRVERLLCQLYAHLLAALLCHHLTAPWRWCQGETSFHKLVQIIQSHTSQLMACFARSGWGLLRCLHHLWQAFQRFGLKSKRRKAPSTTQTIYNWGLT